MYLVRGMSRDELDITLKWVEDESWNPGPNDADCFWSADPQGFFVGVEDDEMVCVGSGIAYDESFGFCGLYITKPGKRSQGFGLKLTEARLAYLGDRVVGIDGVLENEAIYQRIGYVTHYHHRRTQLVATHKKTSPNLVSLKSVPWDSIAAYDRQCFPAVREKFLKAWLEQDASYGLAYLRGGELVGFGVRVPRVEGFKVAPLFADSKEVAHEIMNGLQEGIEGQLLYIDTPDEFSYQTQFQNELGGREVFVTARMYRNGTPCTDSRKVFGIASMELG